MSRLAQRATFDRADIFATTQAQSILEPCRMTNIHGHVCGKLTSWCEQRVAEHRYGTSARLYR